MSKTESINIALTDEMKSFIVSQSGEGTLFATPSEYVRNLIRHEQDRLEIAKLRDSIIEGYQDAIDGKMLESSGDLMADLIAYKNSK